MTTDRSVIGVANPLALAQLVLGRRLDARGADVRTVIGNSLGMPFARLLEPKSGSLIYRGLVPGAGGRMRRLAPGALRADVEHRLTLHTDFAPPAPSAARGTRLVLERAPLAEHLRAAAFASMGEPDPVTTVWVDPGAYVSDGIDATDPVQGNLGDCYFIGALVAVAWTNPAVLRSRPATIGRIPAERIQFSPGYYGLPVHGDGPVFEDVGVTERLPEQAGTGLPLYATSSDGEIWPGVWEKAFAKWRNGEHDDQPDYSTIEGGDCLEATRAIIGRHRRLDAWENAAMTARAVLDAVRASSRGGKTFHPMTAWTYSSADDFPDDGFGRNYDRSSIVFNHCYTILGWARRGPVDYVVLRNPWGWYEATRDDRAEGGTLIGLAPNANGVFALPVEVFRRYFAGFGVVH